MKSPITISVKIGSKKLKVTSVTINQSVVDHHTFSIFTDASEISNKDGVVKGEEVYDMIAKPIAIKIENAKDSKDALDFSGIVTSIDIDKSVGEFDSLIISGKGKTTFIDDNVEIRTYSDTTFSDIAKEVLSDFDGKVDINISPAINIDYCVQYNETPYDFIARLAFMYGVWNYYDGKDIIIGKYDDLRSYNLAVGKNMQSYEIGMNMFPVNKGYTHYDYKEDTSYEQLGGDVSIPDVGNYSEGTVNASYGYYTRKPIMAFRSAAIDENVIKSFTENRVKSVAAQMVLLSGDSGNPGLGIGASVEVKDQDGDNVGKYFITKVSHSWNGAGRYHNHFEGIPASLNHPPPNPHVRLPKAGNQIAVVAEVDDPDNLGRVRVKFPWQSDEMTPWIRVSYPYAGAGDMYFCPEVDDQVMIGFEHNSPDRPYVMGSMYHGKLPPQYANENNQIKAIHTKCGHRIIFEDGDDSMISIYTKGDKNHIILDVKDDGQISIMTEGIMNLQGKTINLEGDELNIKMDSAINIEAGQDVNIKGANVSLTADQAASMTGMEAKVSGDTSAEMTGAQVSVEASATAVLKGGMVQIN